MKAVPAAAGVLDDKTVVISWVEESHHQVTVRVRPDFDVTEHDLGNGLARLRDNGFEFVERAVIDVVDAEDDPTADFFDPPRYDDPEPASGGDSTDAVMIRGQVWTAFLEQEMQLDREHSGDVSLAGVIAEIRTLAAEHAHDAGTAE